MQEDSRDTARLMIEAFWNAHKPTGTPSLKRLASAMMYGPIAGKIMEDNMRDVKDRRYKPIVFTWSREEKPAEK